VLVTDISVQKVRKVSVAWLMWMFGGFVCLFVLAYIGGDRIN